MELNIANAVLILGAIYFGFTYGFSWWIVLIIVFGFGTWSFYVFADKGKELLKLQIEKLEHEIKILELEESLKAKKLGK